MDHFPNSQELACLIGQWARDHPLEPLDNIKQQCFGFDIKDKVLVRMVKNGGYGYDRVWWEMTTEPLLQLVEYMGTTLEVLATAQDRNGDELDEVEWEYTASIKIHANEEPLKFLWYANQAECSGHQVIKNMLHRDDCDVIDLPGASRIKVSLWDNFEQTICQKGVFNARLSKHRLQRHMSPKLEALLAQPWEKVYASIDGEETDKPCVTVYVWAPQDLSESDPQDLSESD
jgi:hypothetical protein